MANTRIKRDVEDRLADRVQETCNSPGLSGVTLLGAVTGFQTFSAAIGNGNTTYYTIADQGGANWEVGIGTYTSSGTTLSRDTVLASSNAGALVSFGSNTKDVWCDYPAGRSVIGSQGYTENANTIATTATINTGNNALSAGPVTVSTGVTITIPTGSVVTGSSYLQSGTVATVTGATHTTLNGNLIVGSPMTLDPNFYNAWQTSVSNAYATGLMQTVLDNFARLGYTISRVSTDGQHINWQVSW